MPYNEIAMRRRSSMMLAMWLQSSSFATGRSAHYEALATGSAAALVRGGRRAGVRGSGNCQGRTNAHAQYE